MKTALLSLLCVCVWSQHTEGVTDRQATLGQSLTLSCEFRCKAAIWFVMKPSSTRPEMILRTFGSEKAEYYKESLRRKYSEGSRSQLIINDVSVDDLGTYYCIKQGLALEISDGIRVDTAQGPNTPESKNPQPVPVSSLMIIVIFSLLMLVLLASAIGLLMVKYKRSKKIPRYVNGQFLERRIQSIQTNSTAGRNSPDLLTNHVYLDLLPSSAY